MMTQRHQKAGGFQMGAVGRLFEWESVGPTFSIHSPFKVIKARFEAAKAELNAKKEEIAQVTGVQYLSLAQRDYRTLSRGGAGSDGRIWKKLAPSTIKRKLAKGNKAKAGRKIAKATALAGTVAIGIDTGLQVASGARGFTAPGGGNIFRVMGWTITVGYGRSYSKYFDMIRKLLPDKIPDAWKQKLSKTFGDWMRKITNKAAEGGP